MAHRGRTIRTDLGAYDHTGHLNKYDKRFFARKERHRDPVEVEKELTDNYDALKDDEE